MFPVASANIARLYGYNHATFVIMDKLTIQGIRQKHGDDNLLKCKGAIGVDVDYKYIKSEKTDKLGITVYVKKKLTKEDLTADEAVPTEIEGVPTDVVECLNVWPGTMAGDDPLAGGLSITSVTTGGTGTLGIIIPQGGTPVALSAAHVMVSSLPGVGQTVIEPSNGNYPQNSIGTVSNVQFGPPSNLDAAIVPVQGRGTRVGYINQIGQVANFAPPGENQYVRKMGATTGLTEGTVSSATFTWKYKSPLGVITLYNQVKVVGGDFARPGDSGSAIVTLIGDKLYMVGMIVSGNEGHFTVCNNSADLRKMLPSSEVSFSQQETM